MTRLPYDLGPAARTAAVFLLLYCAAQLALALLAGILLDLYIDLETTNMSQREMNVATGRVAEIGSAIYGLAILAHIGCYITVGIWIYRAAANAQARMPDPARITPKWAVAWYFIPLANLYLPYVAMRQTWNGLQGNADMAAPMPLVAPAWWLLWIVGNAIAAASLWINTAASSFAEYRLSAQLDFAAVTAAILAALLLRHLIKDMTRASAQPFDTSHPEEYA